MLSERVRRAFDDWKARDITSNRMFGTGVGFVVFGIPFSLWFLVVGPTAGDRLVAVGFFVAACVLAAFSLWEAKHLDGRRSDPDDDGP